jgi:hypothetical protein
LCKIKGLFGVGAPAFCPVLPPGGSFQPQRQSDQPFQFVCADKPAFSVLVAVSAKGDQIIVVKPEIKLFFKRYYVMHAEVGCCDPVVSEETTAADIQVA